MTGLNEAQFMEYDNLRRAPKRIPTEFLQQGRRHRRKGKRWQEARGGKGFLRGCFISLNYAILEEVI